MSHLTLLTWARAGRSLRPVAGWGLYARRPPHKRRPTAGFGLANSDQGCRPLNLGSELVDGGDDERDELLRLVPGTLLHAFADARQRLDPVARVEPRRVREVLEPLAPGEPGVVLERALRGVEQPIQFDLLRAIECRALGGVLSER